MKALQTAHHCSLASKTWYCTYPCLASASTASQEDQYSPQQPVQPSCTTLRTPTSTTRWESTPSGPCFADLLTSGDMQQRQLMMKTIWHPQAKIELPTQLHEKHHLLFSFYHVTCDINAKTNAKRKESLETPGEAKEGKIKSLFCSC